MYALSRGPSKIVASTRRGTPRAFELHENSRDQSDRVDSEAAMSVARPVFNHNHNGRMRHQNQPRPNPHINSNVSTNGGTPEMSPQHQEAATFLLDSWNKAMREYSKNSLTEGGPEWYRPREPHPAQARDFKKFDLDEYYLKKTMRRMTESS